MLLSVNREMPPRRRDCSQIRAVFGDLQRLCGLWFCFTRAGSPGHVLAAFLSLIAAVVCPPCNIRTAVLAPLVDLGGELKQSPVPTGWGDLAFIQQHRAEVVFLSSVDHCLSGRGNRPLEKRHFQKTRDICVGVCSLSHWTCEAKNADWLCHHHGYKCYTWLSLEGSWGIVQHLHRLCQWPCVFWDLVLFKEGGVVRLKREIDLPVSWNLSVGTHTPVLKTLQGEPRLWKQLSLC